MLEINGTVGTKSFDHEVISPKELFKLFGVDERMLDGNIKFLLDSSRHKEVRGKGRREKTRIELKPIIESVYEGRSVSIRYYKTKTPINGGMAGYRYFPDVVDKIRGKKTTVNAGRDSEVAAFLVLHQSNSTSPLYNGKTKRFFTYDGVSASANKISIAKMRTEMVNEILQTPAEDLRKIAGGLNLKVGMVDMSAETEEIRATLIEYAEKDITQFKKQWGDQSTKVRSVIREAIDKKIIVVTADTRFRYAKLSAKFGGDTISSFGLGENVLDQVQSAVMLKPEYLKKVVAALDSTEVEKDMADNAEVIADILAPKKPVPPVEEVPVGLTAAGVDDLTAEQVHKEVYARKLVNSNAKKEVVEVSSNTVLSVNDDKFIEKLREDSVFLSEIKNKIKAHVIRNQAKTSGE